MKKGILLFFVCILFISIVSCGKSQIAFNTDNIEVSLINASEMDGGTYYTLKLKNNSNQIIKYVEMSFGYTLSDEGKQKSNISSLMVPAKPENTSINISPGEECSFITFWPNDLFEEKDFDTDKINIHIIGYVKNLDINNRFEKSGGTEFLINRN